MGVDTPSEPGPKELRTLAAQYRSRADRAEPGTAKLLYEIAEEFEVEARKLEQKS